MASIRRAVWLMAAARAAPRRAPALHACAHNHLWLYWYGAWQVPARDLAALAAECHGCIRQVSAKPRAARAVAPPPASASARCPGRGACSNRAARDLAGAAAKRRATRVAAPPPPRPPRPFLHNVRAHNAYPTQYATLPFALRSAAGPHLRSQAVPACSSARTARCAWCSAGSGPWLSQQAALLVGACVGATVGGGAATRSLSRTPRGPLSLVMAVRPPPRPCCSVSNPEAGQSARMRARVLACPPPIGLCGQRWRAARRRPHTCVVL